MKRNHGNYFLSTLDHHHAPFTYANKQLNMITQQKSDNAFCFQKIHIRPHASLSINNTKKNDKPQKNQ